MKGPDPYSQRDRRAVQLLAAQPHAAEMLGLYRRLLTFQEPLYQRVLSSEWPGFAGPEVSFPPALGLERLAFADLAAPFHRFVEEVSAVAPAALATAGKAVGRAAAEARQDLLQRSVEQDSLAALATALACEVPHLAFYARAFLQPIAEGLAARQPREIETDSRTACRRCGWPPQVAAVRDEPEIRGRRLLVCGLCATWWAFPRGMCAGCGETEPRKLTLHESESLPYIRVEECGSCHAYIKSVDLRREGVAVPEVDDIASVELDLWAEERELWKISRNLLGL